jgi:branched-chain amino acid transport system ATP-binding protein
VSIDVCEREIVAVLGGNGAGKTTLLRTLSGVMVRSEAQVQLQGVELSQLRAHQRVHAGLAHVPEGRRVFGDLTVVENLTAAGHARRATPAELREDLDRACVLFPRLAERRTQRARSLSGGEQQMLAIGRALMSRPTLLMLDEASLGLAPAVVHELFDALGRLRDDGLSILLVEQNVREGLRLADRGYVLSRGTVAVAGTAEQLLSDEQVAATYLGLSQIQANTARTLEKR